MPEPTDLLTTAEAAERLGTTVPTLNRWAGEGRIPTARKLPGLRGARLFSESDLDAFAEAEAIRTAGFPAALPNECENTTEAAS